MATGADPASAALLEPLEDDMAPDNALEFQNFHLSDAPAAPAPAKTAQYKTTVPAPDWTSAAAVQSQIDDGSGAGPSGRPAPNESSIVGAARKYFDVDTVQVLERIRLALLPTKSTFLERTSVTPDLYGLWWISITVVVVLFFTGNMAKSVAALESGVPFEPDFSQMSVAFATIIPYQGLVPLVLWLIMRYYNISIDPLSLWCLYGYALFIFIPVSIICVAPFEWLKWTFSMLAFVHSALFITLNLWPVLAASGRREGFFIMIGALVVHFGLTLVFKFVFYTYEPIGVPPV